MNLEDIKPGNCLSRAQKLVATLDLIREEMGRTKDPRKAPEITGASPRACYLQAIAAWHKASRLSEEVGIRIGRPAPPVPAVTGILPGHVHQLIDAVLVQVQDVAQLLGISQKTADPAADLTRTPSDVLSTLMQANRDLAMMLERPPAPSDVYRTVALALAYATRLTNKPVELAPFEHKKKPADVYARIESALAQVSKLVAKHGPAIQQHATQMPYVIPSDCYDVAHTLLAEIAYVHAHSATAAAVQPFEPYGDGHRLPSHVFQLVRTLEAQLATIS